VFQSLCFSARRWKQKETKTKVENSYPISWWRSGTGEVKRGRIHASEALLVFSLVAGEFPGDGSILQRRTEALLRVQLKSVENEIVCSESRCCLFGSRGLFWRLSLSAGMSARANP